MEIVKISQMAIKELLKVQNSKTRQSILTSVSKSIKSSSIKLGKFSIKTNKTAQRTNKPWCLTQVNTKKSTEAIAKWLLSNPHQITIMFHLVSKISTITKHSLQVRKAVWILLEFKIFTIYRSSVLNNFSSNNRSNFTPPIKTFKGNLPTNNARMLKYSHLRHHLTNNWLNTRQPRFHQQTRNWSLRVLALPDPKSDRNVAVILAIFKEKTTLKMLDNSKILWQNSRNKTLI